jgi:hypothetical protein
MEEFVEGSDYVRKMKADLEVLTTLNLQSPTDSERETALNTIEHLCDLCDDIDVAGGTDKKIFVKFKKKLLFGSAVSINGLLQISTKSADFV